MGCFFGFGCGVDCLFFCLVLVMSCFFYSRFFLSVWLFDKNTEKGKRQKGTAKNRKGKGTAKNIIFLALIISPYNRGIIYTKKQVKKGQKPIVSFLSLTPKNHPEHSAISFGFLADNREDTRFLVLYRQSNQSCKE